MPFSELAALHLRFHGYGGSEMDGYVADAETLLSACI